MKNNVVFKKVCIANALRQFEIKEIFALGGMELSSSAIKAFAAGAKHKNHKKMSDAHLEAFLNGLIVYWRGEKNTPGLVPQGLENLILGAHPDMLLELESLVAEARLIIRDTDTTD